MKKMKANTCPVASKGKTLVYKESQAATRSKPSLVIHGVGSAPDSREDVLREGVVIDSRFDHFTQGTCRAFKCLELVFLDNGDCINPGNSETVDCAQCPILKANPNSRGDSISYDEAKAMIKHWSNPAFERWLATKASEWRNKTRRYDEEHESLRDESVSDPIKRAEPIPWQREKLRVRNDAAGRFNAYSFAKANMKLMEYDDLVDSIKQYGNRRKREGVNGVYGQAIYEACQDILDRLPYIGCYDYHEEHAQE